MCVWDTWNANFSKTPKSLPELVPSTPRKDLSFQWLLLLLSFVCVAREGSSCGCQGNWVYWLSIHTVMENLGFGESAGQHIFALNSDLLSTCYMPILSWPVYPPHTHTHMISGLRKSCLVRGHTLDEEIHISYMIVHCGTWNKAQDLDPMKEKTHFLRVWNYIWDWKQE